ncbi:hypothetical protein [Mariniluteicoccus flavus]
MTTDNLTSKRITADTDAYRAGANTTEAAGGGLNSEVETFLGEVSDPGVLGRTDTIGKFANPMYAVAIGYVGKCLGELGGSYDDHAGALRNSGTQYDSTEAGNAAKARGVDLQNPYSTAGAQHDWNTGSSGTPTGGHDFGARNRSDGPDFTDPTFGRGADLGDEFKGGGTSAAGVDPSTGAGHGGGGYGGAGHGSGPGGAGYGSGPGGAGYGSGPGGAGYGSGPGGAGYGAGGPGATGSGAGGPGGIGSKGMPGAGANPTQGASPLVANGGLADPRSGRLAGPGAAPVAGAGGGPMATPMPLTSAARRREEPSRLKGNDHLDDEEIADEKDDNIWDTLRPLSPQQEKR